MAGNGSTFDRDQPAPLSSGVVRSEQGTESSAGALATPIVNIRPVGASLGRGTRLGRYAIVDRIGSGGMGDVYSAHDSELDRKVAIKLVRPETVADDSSTGRARLLREAQAMARLSHPNVVAVYDMGTFSGQVFIAMEYVVGRTLRRWLAEGSRSWREVVGIFIEAGRGLAAAHSAQLLHRDFKPENVLVANDGRVRVVDFGLARATDRELLAADAPRPSADGTGSGELALELTRAGMMVGTPAYMAPEAWQGQAVDSRSDQFSFCVALYEAVHGERPFAGEDVSILMREVLAGRVKTPRFGRRVPSRLREVILRGLENKPDERYPSMDALLIELRSIQNPPPGDEDTHTTNVERRARKFIGRRHELDQLTALLDRADAPIITLLGTGGVGKTRLATEFAITQVDRFSGEGRGGTWFCDLSEVKALDGMLNAVAQLLGVPLATGTSSEGEVAQLGYALAARGPLLLILDNFEQVVQLAPTTLGVWVDMAPEARFLVTSRELLRLPAERQVEVPPLGVPAPDAVDVELIEKSDSVKLFLERVRSVRDWSYSPNAAEARAIAQIVRRLEGIPLAIELAAARMNVLSAAQVAKGLERPLALLTAGVRGARTRQATLRGTIQWSWELLSEVEKEALEQCSIFRGGFSLDAAEAVIGFQSRPTPMVLDLIQALREKSLLRTYQGKAGELRFGMYEAIREFVSEQLPHSGSESQVGLRHTRYFLTMAERWHAVIHQHGGVDALRSMALDWENLLCAFERECHRAPRTDDSVSTVLKLALYLDPILVTRGPVEAHQAMLDAAVSASSGLEIDPSLRARVVRLRGQLFQRRGRIAEAMGELETAQRMALTAGDRLLEGTLLVDLSILHREQGRMAESQAAIQSAARMNIADPWFQAYLAGNTGILDYELGRHRDAELHYERALKIFREVGDRRYEGIFEGNYGLLHRDQLRLATARSQFEKCIAALREVGDQRYEGMSLDYLASTLWEEGFLQEARACLQKAVTMLQEAGDRRQSCIAMAHLGGVCASLAQLEEARVDFGRVDALVAEMDDPLVRAEAELSHGHLDLARSRQAGAAGDREEAQRLEAQARGRIETLDQNLVAASSDVRVAIRSLSAVIKKLRGEQEPVRPV